jgi:hypothetical protein
MVLVPGATGLHKSRLLHSLRHKEGSTKSIGAVRPRDTKSRLVSGFARDPLEKVIV